MDKDGNLLILTGWSFKDALIQTATLPYVNIIREILPLKQKIFVVTAEQPRIALSNKETIDINREWKRRNMKLLPGKFKRFGIKKLIDSSLDILKLFILIKRENIKKIHAFCTPAGSLAYLLSRFTGADLIIDSYEPHAEPMVENGSWTKKGIKHRLLFNLEKKLSQKAVFIIATTKAMKDYARQKYNVELKNFFVKPACVDLVKFSPSEKDSSLLEELSIYNKKICVYAGKLGGIYLKEEVFDFIRSCYDHWKDDFRFLMLTNASSEDINKEIKRTKLPPHIVISRFVFHDEIPRYLSLGDFAINPVKPVPTKRYCTSIKDGEYWAKGLPVIISPNISDDSSIIEQENAGIVMDFTDKSQFLSAIGKMEQLLKSKRKLKQKIFAIAKKYRSFEIAYNIYRRIYKKTQFEVPA